MGRFGESSYIVKDKRTLKVRDTKAEKFHTIERESLVES